MVDNLGKMKAGQLIICEGGEGSGKTTLIKNLATELTAAGGVTLVTREPGGTVFAEEVRELLIKKRQNDADYASLGAQLLGHYAARFDHLAKVIKPALMADKIVLCDRFELSTYAYQVYGREAELRPLFSTLHQEVCSLLNDFKLTYLICDLDPTEGLRRVSSRQGETNYFDELDLSFHHRVREGTKIGQEYIADCFKFHTIDASKSPAEMVKAARLVLAL